MSTTIKEEPKLPTAWDVKTEKYELPDLGNLSSGLKRKQHDTVPLTNDYKLLRALSTDESRLIFRNILFSLTLTNSKIK